MYIKEQQENYCICIECRFVIISRSSVIHFFKFDHLVDVTNQPCLLNI